MRKIVLKALLALFACATLATARAEDIDLFVGATPNLTDAPSVLIILDNTANWNSAFANEKAALVSLFSGLTLNKFRVGLMMFSETGGGNGGNDGAYVRAAIRLMDSTNRPIYVSLVNNLDQTGDKSNGGKAAKSMEEAYLYLTGGTPHAGNNKTKADYTGNQSSFGTSAQTAASTATWALAGNALASKTATSYNNPISGTCSKINIIYISNGAAQDNTSDLTQASNALAAAGGNTTAIPINPSGSQDNVADEWARFMRLRGLGARVYTLDVNKVTTGQGPGWSALMKSMADVGGGKYFDVAASGTQILDALNVIFAEIQSVNTAFASVSLPVSVNTQGTYLNQVYVGMFRPDPDGFPRWAGNLKQFKLGQTSGILKLQDATDTPAINNQTGFITECARSFWTPSVLDAEWSQRPNGACTAIANSESSNYPDGNVVEKGAQAYKLRGAASRTVYTCGAATCTSLLAFNNTNVSQAQLLAADTTERDLAINWAIGKDNKNDENLDGSSTDNRLSMHGDVVHSRPVAINFGTDASPNVVVYYGGNDGWLRAVNGNRANAISTIPAGGELWAFMPPEFYSSVTRLRNNSVTVAFPNTAVTSPAPQPKNYGVDGPVTAFKGTIGGSSKSIVYATLRRGGRSIYAFDVSNSLTSPTAPTLKWRIGCPNQANDTGCTSGLTGIGQTWSSLKSFTTTGVTSPMMIFGGGYDTCDDSDSGGANNACTSSSKGHYIYVLDADTGAVLKTFDTGGNRGVIADVTLVRGGDGGVTYGYTADLGGNVYRLTFGNGAAASWKIDQIASLGCDTTASCTANRKFMFAPSVVAVNSDYMIMLGSGDREKPLTYYTVTAAVTNYFFSFTDKPSDSSWPGSADCGSAIVCKASLLSVSGTATPTTAQLATKKGWYLGLASTEQVVTSAVTIFGVVTFSTHQPATNINTCASNLGKSLVYNVGYTNAASANGTTDRFEDLAGDGLPPSPVAGRVTLDSGVTVPFCIGCSKDSPLEGSPPREVGSVVQPKGRLYWYLQK